MSKHEDTSNPGNVHQVRGCIPDSSSVPPSLKVDCPLWAGVACTRRITLLPFCFQKLNKISFEILLYVGAGRRTEQAEKKKKRRIHSFELVKIRTCFNEE